MNEFTAKKSKNSKKSITKNNSASEDKKEITREVLFQKLGATWFIFTEIDNQVVYSSMPDGMDPRTTKLELYDIIEDHLKKVSDLPKYRSPEVA